MTAQRRNDIYCVGNYHITHISKEEYNEILVACGKETDIGHCHIVYMNNAPRELLSKYAKRVRESEFHKHKDAKDLEHKIWSMQSDLNAIKELESLIID